MNAYYTMGLLAFLVLAAVLLVRYVHSTVDKEFVSLARAVADGEYREDELRRVDALLAGSLPLPDDVKPLAGPISAGRGALAPMLLAVGVILLWGGGAATEEKGLWFYGGLVCALAAAGIMLVSLRKRKWERVARLLRFRADLKRLDGRRQGAADDLVQLIKLTPWDDAAWAELSDDLAAEGDVESALEAMRQAERLDPRYDEYRMLVASLAIRLGKLDMARDAIKAWVELDGVQPDDPRPVMYRAALELAEGKREAAAQSLRAVLADPDAPLEYLDTDQALRGVKDLLPGRGGNAINNEQLI